MMHLKHVACDGPLIEEYHAFTKVLHVQKISSTDGKSVSWAKNRGKNTCTYLLINNHHTLHILDE